MHGDGHCGGVLRHGLLQQRLHVTGVLGLALSWQGGSRGVQQLGRVILDAKHKQVSLSLCSHIPSNSRLKKLIWRLLARVGYYTHTTLYHEDGCARGWRRIVELLCADRILQARQRCLWQEQVHGLTARDAAGTRTHLHWLLLLKQAPLLALSRC